MGTVPTAPLPQSGQILTEQTDSVITPARAFYAKLTRWNPLRNLQPETLSTYMDMWYQGYLRYFVLMLQAICDRDDMLKVVIPKRFSAVKRLHWDVVIQENIKDEDRAEAEEQRAFLYDFYNGSKTTHASDLNLNAGIAELLGQMLSCHIHKWAVHELIWQPTFDGRLTCRFNFVPLQFFENRTGKLRFLETDYALNGRDIEDGSFMITCGLGLGEPSAVAYMYKNLGLKDWVIYSEKVSSPGVIGKTDAPLNSTNWDNMVAAVKAISSDFAAVVSKDDELNKIDFSHAGNSPFQPLVDRMDRAIACIWRGADLSTISGKGHEGGMGGQGASLQGKEEYNILCDDAAMINETLNMKVDPLAIKWKFGPDARVMANFKLQTPSNIEVNVEIQKFNFMRLCGIELGQDQIREFFGVGKMLEGDKPIAAMPTVHDKPLPLPQAGNPDREVEGVNERRVDRKVDDQLLRTAADQFAKATGDVFKPVRDRINAILEMPNEARVVAYVNFRHQLPEMLKEINSNPANAVPVHDALVSGWFNGLINSAVIQN